MEIKQTGLVVLAAVSIALNIALGYVNGVGSGVFNHTIAELSAKYSTEVTPAAFAFGVAWGIIYIWNVLINGFLLVSLVLPAEASPVKFNPTLAPKGFLLGIIVTWSCCTGWFFAFDEENLELSLNMLLLSALGLYFALGISYKVVYENEARLENSSKVLLWLMRILVQNGLALAATWLTVASTIGLADVIAYKDSPGADTAMLRGGLSVAQASTVSLAILTAGTILWFIVENFAVEKYCRYTFTIYPILIFALSALVVRLQPLPNAKQNLIFACIALGVAGVAFLARIALSVSRFINAPPQPYMKKLVPTL